MRVIIMTAMVWKGMWSSARLVILITMHWKIDNGQSIYFWDLFKHSKMWWGLEDEYLWWLFGIVVIKNVFLYCRTKEQYIGQTYCFVTLNEDFPHKSITIYLLKTGYGCIVLKHTTYFWSVSLQKMYYYLSWWNNNCSPNVALELGFKITPKRGNYKR